MTRFVLGVVVGVLAAIGYVRFDLALPSWLQLPDMLRGNLVSTATESALYDLDPDPAVRTRALEVYFANRAREAAKVDAEAGSPFIQALHKSRAVREARQLTGEWSASSEVLTKPALREALERKLGTSDTGALKLQLLADALDRKPFIKSWLERHAAPLTRDGLPALLKRIAAQ